MAIGIASDVNLEKEAEERRRRLMQQRMSDPQHAAMPTKEKSAGEQMIDIASEKAMNKASDTFIDPMIEKGMSKAGQLASFVSPQAMTGAQLGALQGASAGKAMSASGMLGGGMSPGMAQAVLGSGKAAAPLVAQTAGMTGGQLAAATAPGLTSAATAGAAGAAGGMAPMLAALGPIGLGIGGLMLAKKLKLFSEGGKVGPLYSAEGDKAKASQAVLNSILEQKKKKEARKNQTLLENLAGVEYNAIGGPAGFRRNTSSTIGGFLPVTGNSFAPVTGGTQASTARTNLNYTPTPISTTRAAGPLSTSEGLPTSVNELYNPQSVKSFYQSNEGSLDENPYAWTWQNIDNTGDYYVMGSANDDMMMVPTGGQAGVGTNNAMDNYWRVMDKAAGGDGGVGITGLTSSGSPAE